MDEKLQIQKVLKGDHSAFGYFVDTYQDMAMTIAYRVCGNMQDAEDIVQDSFVKAFHNLHAFKSDSKFSTWFYRIVYNTAITEIKNFLHNVRFIDYEQMEIADSYADFDTLAQIEEDEKKELLNKALDRMPRDESLILTLFYLEENSIKDITKITGLTESNIKVKLHRARKRMYDMMTELMKQ
ncbi:MAG: RNA polymerase sigma factor [Tannerella sp.]|jgi:RNA polymerase sigma-70 factor (ECF subfamily)|nr:RNA polymerase sigma factor [Tannerella sp.]